MVRTCFLCGCNGSVYGHRIERHHIFGAANRKLSEKYGLVVDLCHACHNEPPYGAHHNAEAMLYLHQYGQKKAMQENNWTIEQFVEVFGKNYLGGYET
jgi:hypothetical protein